MCETEHNNWSDIRFHIFLGFSDFQIFFWIFRFSFGFSDFQIFLILSNFLILYKIQIFFYLIFIKICLFFEEGVTASDGHLNYG